MGNMRPNESFRFHQLFVSVFSAERLISSLNPFLCLPVLLTKHTTDKRMQKDKSIVEPLFGQSSHASMNEM